MISTLLEGDIDGGGHSDWSFGTLQHPHRDHHWSPSTSARRWRRATIPLLPDADVDPWSRTLRDKLRRPHLLGAHVSGYQGHHLSRDTVTITVRFIYRRPEKRRGCSSCSLAGFPQTVVDLHFVNSSCPALDTPQQGARARVIALSESSGARFLPSLPFDVDVITRACCARCKFSGDAIIGANSHGNEKVALATPFAA